MTAPAPLPRALRAWTRELACFPPDLGLVVGKLMARLAPALAGSATLGAARAGEPDGYDGLTRRGPLERLVASEWALAQAAPLEFLRRAVHAEHAFFALARREPAEPRGTVVLYDAGPEVLGAARIVELALVLLLVARARGAGGAFLLEALHAAPQLGADVGTTTTEAEAAVRAFVAARSGRRAGALALTAALERHTRSEVWVLAGPTLAAHAHGRAHVVSVSEVVPPGERELRVEVRARAAAPRALVLELPEADACVRLLRDPFERPRSRLMPAPNLPAGDLLWNTTGSRLFVGGTSAQLAAFGVPNRPLDRLAAPRHYQAPPGMRVTGIGRVGRTIGWLCVSPGLALLRTSRPLRWDAGTSLRLSAPIATESEPAPGAPELAQGGARGLSRAPQLWPVALFANPLSAVFVASDRALWRLDFARQSAHRLAEGVRAVAAVKDGGAYVAVERYEENGQASERILCVHSTGVTPTTLLADAAGPVFLRAPSSGGTSLVSGCVLAHGTVRIERRAAAHLPPRVALMQPPEGARLVDVHAEPNGELGLLWLEAGSLELTRASRRSTQLLHKSPEPIDRIAVASGSGRIALTTTGGELVLMDASGKLRWRGRPAT